MKMPLAAAAFVFLACGSSPDRATSGSVSRVWVEVRGPGRVLSLPPAIDCPGTCTAAFPLGSAVTLVAAPPDGALFREWAGDCGGATGCHLSLVSDLAVGAEFDRM